MNPEMYTRMAAVEDEHWWFRARRGIVASLIQRLNLPPNSRILEAGAGTGGNLPMLSAFGEVVGMELDEGARALAARKAGVPVVAGRLPEVLPFQPGSFELITLLDVLEHVEEDQVALQSLAALLKPGGSLLLTVPAFAFLWSGHDVVHRHYRRYRRPELMAKVEAAGLQVVYASYYNSLLFPLVVAVRLVEKVLGVKGGQDLSMPPAWLNRMLEWVFASEQRWLGRMVFPFGVSLVLLARRPA